MIVLLNKVNISINFFIKLNYIHLHTLTIDVVCEYRHLSQRMFIQ